MRASSWLLPIPLPMTSEAPRALACSLACSLSPAIISTGICRRRVSFDERTLVSRPLPSSIGSDSAQITRRIEWSRTSACQPASPSASSRKLY
jgi:hypothetical protein